MTTSDIAFMRRAIREAKKGLGRTAPNPAVGAVIVHDGRIVAVGHHARAGEAHAEVDALRKVDFEASGMTMYSTMEPCNHHGRTGPCTKAIRKAGIRRVVIGTLDPNPHVAGGGVGYLRRSGIEVTTDVLEGECRRLNEAFNFAIMHRRPFVVAKLAMSLDGHIATRTGESQWITSEAARNAGHSLRNELDGILVGVGTVLADDPKLTCRLPKGRNPIRVILDSQLRTPLNAHVVQAASEIRTIFATTRAAPKARRQAFESAGAEILLLKKTRSGGIDLMRLLEALTQRGVNGVLVEGGPQVLGSFMDAGLINKVVAFVAPLVIGGREAPSAVGGRGVARLSEALRLERLETRTIGSDIQITGYAAR